MNNQGAQIAALIPAYNPGEVVIGVVEKTLSQVNHVILVNDGSDETNTSYLKQLAKQYPQVTLIEHPSNFGKGFAIRSGLTQALKADFDYVIMLDSDGQHDPNEIATFKEKIEHTKAPFIIGTRLQTHQMPLKSKLGNMSMAWAFKLVTGKKLVDTQSGYRALSKKFIEVFLSQCKPGRYETEMKMLFLAAKQSDHIEQIPISTIYIDDNKNSKFRPIQDSVRVLSSFLLFAGVGVLSFLLDYCLFLLFTLMANSYFLNAHVLSRVLSSVFNYAITKKYVFANKDSVASTSFKYILAVFTSLLLSSALLYFLVDYLNWNPLVAKPSAELITFFINFFVLKHFVFQKLNDE